MRFYKVKIDINDKLFSQIVRHGLIRCPRCGVVHALQCAHIFSRRYYSTRFNRRNAVALCADCHDWFDSHKINAVLFDEDKRVFAARDEGYTWLVQKMNYTWDELIMLYAKAQAPFQGYSYKKKEITEVLRTELSMLREAA